MQKAKPCLCAALLLLAATFAVAQAVIPGPDFIETGPHAPSMQACPIYLNDGDIVFIRVRKSIYAVKVTEQTTYFSGRATYTYLKIGAVSPDITTATSGSFPGGLRLGGIVVPWSATKIGEGCVYFTAAHRGLPPDYEIGLPFYQGDVKTFRKAIPPDVNFQSLPDTGWKNVMAN